MDVAGGEPLTTVPLQEEQVGVETTVYVVMDAPPFEPGGNQETTADELPPDADTLDGAPGTVRTGCGVTGFDAAEGTLVPPVAFVAVTVNV